MGLFSKKDSYKIKDGVCSIAFEESGELTKERVDRIMYKKGAMAYSKNNVSIGEGVTAIGDSAFENCIALKSIEILSGVTIIGDSAFSWCSRLTSIEIPEGVTAIGSYAFCGCNNLTVFCEAEEQPDGWSRDWDSDGIAAKWGYELFQKARKGKQTND